MLKLPDYQRHGGLWGCQDKLLQRLLSEGCLHGCPEMLQLQGQGTASTDTAGISSFLKQSVGTGGSKSSSTSSTLCSLLSLFFPWHTRIFLSFTCHKYNSSKQANHVIFLQQCLKFPFFPQGPETRVRTWKFALKKSSVHFLLSCLEDAVTFPDSK